MGDEMKVNFNTTTVSELHRLIAEKYHIPAASFYLNIYGYWVFPNGIYRTRYGPDTLLSQFPTTNPNGQIGLVDSTFVKIEFGA